MAAFGRSPGLRKSMSAAANFKPSFNPFIYTQGRWLDRDAERREARRLDFDFDALLNIAVRSSPGAKHVVSCEKREGGFNRVFMIRLDNAHTVVARLPTRLAGPSRLTVSSEVATLQFVKEKTSVPVPEVLSSSVTTENSIGADYMILECMPGVPLKDVWNDMKATQHIACIQAIGKLCTELCDLKFSTYGSLYLNANAPPGAVTLDDAYCIGPLCAPQHWDPGDRPHSMHPGRGPWFNVQEYFSELIARTKSKSIAGKGDSSLRHAELLDAFEHSLRSPSVAELIRPCSGPMLSHPDLHTRNIFVDEEDHTKITGIIDWQSAAIEPAFVFAADTPDFAQELPEEPASVISAANNGEKVAYERLRADLEFCINTWTVMQQCSGKLAASSRLDPILLRALAAPSVGWIREEIALEALFKDLDERWSQLGIPGQGTYPQSAKEDLAERLDEFNASRELRDWLSRLLRCDSDGWVPNDRWEATLALHRNIYDQFVESVVQTEECKNKGGGGEGSGKSQSTLAIRSEVTAPRQEHS